MLKNDDLDRRCRSRRLFFWERNDSDWSIFATGSLGWLLCLFFMLMPLLSHNLSIVIFFSLICFVVLSYFVDFLACTVSSHHLFVFVYFDVFCFCLPIVFLLSYLVIFVYSFYFRIFAAFVYYFPDCLIISNKHQGHLFLNGLKVE